MRTYRRVTLNEPRPSPVSTGPSEKVGTTYLYRRELTLETPRSCSTGTGTKKVFPERGDTGKTPTTSKRDFNFEEGVPGVYMSKTHPTQGATSRPTSYRKPWVGGCSVTSRKTHLRGRNPLDWAERIFNGGVGDKVRV